VQLPEICARNEDKISQLKDPGARTTKEKEESSSKEGDIARDGGDVTRKTRPARMAL